MSKKKKSSVRIAILLPVMVLGVVSILSNLMAITNIRKVNKNAEEITNTYMVELQELAEIQRISINRRFPISLRQILTRCVRLSKISRSVRRR